VTIEDRLDVLKGRWLVAAQSRKPSGWRRDRFDVAYDEFTEDNLPNRLFKATVHRLSRWSQWTDTRLRGRSHFGAAKARRRLTQLRPEEVAADSHRWTRIPATTIWPQKGTKKHKGCHSELARNLWLLSAMVA
jgi:5-methylcytosine-specific restriction endonuclease McrBC regulatory subunit McrC